MFEFGDDESLMSFLFVTPTLKSLSKYSSVNLHQNRIKIFFLPQAFLPLLTDARKAIIFIPPSVYPSRAEYDMVG